MASQPVRAALSHLQPAGTAAAAMHREKMFTGNPVFFTGYPVMYTGYPVPILTGYPVLSTGYPVASYKPSPASSHRADIP